MTFILMIFSINFVKLKVQLLNIFFLNGVKQGAVLKPIILNMTIKIYIILISGNIKRLHDLVLKGHTHIS